MRAVGLGAGGHAAVVIEILRSVRGVDLVGLLDPRADLRDCDVLRVPVIGSDDALLELRDGGIDAFFVAVGSAGDTSLRRRLYDLGVSAGLTPLDVIHDRATVSASASHGHGLTVTAHAVVGARARLGHNVLVNTGAIVEHDCRLADHVYVASGAQVGAGAEVGEGAHIGLGASVNQGVVIGVGAVIGSGAAVVRDVGPGTTVVGVPARPLDRSRP